MVNILSNLYCFYLSKIKRNIRQQKSSDNVDSCVLNLHNPRSRTVNKIVSVIQHSGHFLTYLQQKTIQSIPKQFYVNNFFHQFHANISNKGQSKINNFFNAQIIMFKLTCLVWKGHVINRRNRFLIQKIPVMPLLFRAACFRYIWIFPNPLNKIWNPSVRGHKVFFTSPWCSHWKYSHYNDSSINLHCHCTYKFTEHPLRLLFQKYTSNEEFEHT